MEDKKLEFKEVYIKINTVPIVEELDINSKEAERFKETYGEAKELDTNAKILKCWKKDAAKSPVFGKIESITIAFVYNGSIRSVIYKGAEKDVINALYEQLNSDAFSKSKLLSWNFDFMTDFFSVRPLAVSVDLSTTPMQIKDSFNKSWSRKLSEDLMDKVSPGWHKTSFVNTLFATGMDYSKILYGEDLINAKDKEKFESNVEFIKGLVNIHRKLNNEEIIEEINSSLVDVAPNFEAERKPVLNRIYLNNTISSEDKKELKELLGRQRITKKGKEILIDMLHKLSVNSEMFKSDKPAIVEEKLKTVEELINNL